MMAKKYPGTRRFFGRKELTNLMKTTYASYLKFCQIYQVPEVDQGKLDGKHNIIRFTNGSEILLLDLAYKPSDPLYTRL
nr:MAG TPA: terminase large subunit [Caudoviricetes sp.]DAW30782.1 MAG TPA: terminase large subunit [Caudoviricetes sp.]